jgi:hypothetical protein
MADVDEADDRYNRRTFTLSPEADRLLEELKGETGKGYSEIVCLGLLALRGNNRLLRHTLAQPLNRLRVNANLLAALHQGSEDVEIHREIRQAFEQVERVLCPPQLPATPAAAERG